MEELTFRIDAILRRVQGKKNRERTFYNIGKHYAFDTQKQILSYTCSDEADAERIRTEFEAEVQDGKATKKLTTKESELLSLLCAHMNEILQRDFALKKIWIDDNYFNARSMDVYITKLRKHLRMDEEVEIINIHGKGYKLIAKEEEENED